MKPSEVARSGAEYLAGLMEPTGRFKYRFDADTGTSAGDYNLLRHCGTTWSILEVTRNGGGSGRTAAAAKRAVAYIYNDSLKFLPDLDRACLAENGEVKLGGNGLGILALLAYADAAGDRFAHSVAAYLAAYIVSQQKIDGDFVHKRELATAAEIPFESEYYTGEALFALVKLHTATSEWRWLDCAARTEFQLAKRDYGVAQQSHWMLYALEELTRHRPVPEFISHAGRIARHIVDHPGYREHGRSTPIACRTEGLLAYLRMMDRSTAVEEQELRAACGDAIRENLVLQLAYRRPDGGFIRGGSDKRRNEIRIDYVQHNISAFHYYRLVAPDDDI